MPRAGGQEPRQTVAPASASALAIAKPNPPSSETPATKARLPRRSIGSIRGVLPVEDSVRYSRPVGEVRSALLGAERVQRRAPEEVRRAPDADARRERHDPGGEQEHRRGGHARSASRRASAPAPTRRPGRAPAPPARRGRRAPGIRPRRRASPAPGSRPRVLSRTVSRSRCIRLVASEPSRTMRPAARVKSAMNRMAAPTLPRMSSSARCTVERSIAEMFAKRSTTARCTAPRVDGAVHPHQRHQRVRRLLERCPAGTPRRSWSRTGPSPPRAGW